MDNPRFRGLIVINDRNPLRCIYANILTGSASFCKAAVLNKKTVAVSVTVLVCIGIQQVNFKI